MHVLIMQHPLEAMLTSSRLPKGSAGARYGTIGYGARHGVCKVVMHARVARTPY